MKQYLADFGLLFVGIFWGLGFVFVKIGLNTGIDPFCLSAIRFLVGGIILYGIFFRKVGKFKKNDVLAGLIVGIFQFFGYAFQTYGAMLTTASKNAFFTSINVIIVPYIFWFLHKKRPDIFAFLASVICVMGVAVISFDRKMNLANLNFGDILTILCALGFALNILLFSKIKKFNINIINITIMQMLTIGILAFIFQIIFEKKVINFSMNFSLIYLILICTMLNFTIQNISQKYVPAHIMGLILSLEAIFGTVFAIIFLNETISQNFIIGTFLIAIAVILIQYFENKRGD